MSEDEKNGRILDEIRKPLQEAFTAGKDAVSNAVKNSEESQAFFEKLAEKLSVYTGQTTVENTELKYNKNYPEGEKE